LRSIVASGHWLPERISRRRQAAIVADHRNLRAAPAAGFRLRGDTWSTAAASPAADPLRPPGSRGHLFRCEILPRYDDHVGHDGGAGPGARALDGHRGEHHHDRDRRRPPGTPDSTRADTSGKAEKKGGKMEKKAKK